MNRKRMYLYVFLVMALVANLIGMVQPTQTAAAAPAQQDGAMAYITTPAAGAGDVALDTYLQIQFDQPLDPGSFTTSTFRLRAQDEVTDIPAEVSVSGQTVRLLPTALLKISTHYTATVEGAKKANGELLPLITWQFTTRLVGTMVDDTTDDFSAGTPTGGMRVTETLPDDGELSLAAADGSEFTSSTFPNDWVLYHFPRYESDNGVWTINDGRLTLDGMRAGSTHFITTGQSVEFEASVAPALIQAFGLDMDHEGGPYVIFGTNATGTELIAAVNTEWGGDRSYEVIEEVAGDYLGTPHRYKIEWTPTSFIFYIDGTQVAQHNAVIEHPLRPVIGEWGTGGAKISASYIRVTPYATDGSFTSRVFDAGHPAIWNSIAWTAELPEGSTLTINTRTGNTATPDDTWTAWTPIATSGSPVGEGRYAQYSAAFTSTDTKNPPFLKDVTLSYSVAAPPDAPEAVSAGVTTPEDSAVAVHLTVTDPKGEGLTYNHTQTAHGTLTGIAPDLTYTPNANWSGTDSFTFTGYDGTFTSNTAAITITVTPVYDPVVIAPVDDTAIDELTLLDFTATATNVDNSVLTYSLKNAPTGAAVEPATGAFTWTPSEEQGPGNHTYQVCVSDGTTESCDSLTVVVSEVNAAPVLDPIGKKLVVEETALIFTATATDSDIPSDTLTFSITGAPEGAVVSGGTITWTPTEIQGPNTYQIHVCVSDTEVSDCEDVEIEVAEANLAPEALDDDNYTTLEDTLYNTVSSGAQGVLTNDTDPDFNTLSAVLVTPAAHGTVVLNSNGTFTYNPNPNYSGTDTFTYRATDGALSDEAVVTITVMPINDPPVVTIPGNQEVNELNPLTFIATATDVEGPAPTFYLTAAPIGATINATSGAFAWTPTEAQGTGGSYTFNVCATDGAAPVCPSLTVTVLEVNVAPVLNGVQNRSAVEGEPLTFTASATDADLPASSLLFSLNGAPAGASIDEDSGVFTWTPGEQHGGASYTFDVCVTDGEVLVCKAMTVNVNEFRNPPELNPIGDRQVVEKTQIAFTVTAADSDVPPDALSFTMIDAPVGATLNPETGAFAWTPTEEQGPGIYTFEICVTDNVTPDCETITLTVIENNTSPQIATITNKKIDHEATLAFSVSVTDSDLPAQSLKFSLVTGPSGAMINENTGAFSWTAPRGAHGIYTVTVKVVDNGNPARESSATFTIQVGDGVLLFLPVTINIGK